MKRIIGSLGAMVMLLAAHVAWGQQEGLIHYDVKVNLHRMMPDRKEMLPEFRVHKQVLVFNDHESLYKPDPDEEDDADTDAGGGARIRFRQPKMVIYKNTETGDGISQRDFMGKDYLVKDSAQMPPWKIGTEVKTILGHACTQAFYTDEETKQVITAWFTNDIRAELGPDRFNTLPGAVLALDINNGERTTIARKIDMRPLKKNELTVPSSGTPVTRTEFRKMVEEQRAKRGSQNSFIIRN